VRDRHERVRLRRPVLADGELDESRDPVGGEDRKRDGDEWKGASPDDREHEAEREPDEAMAADLRQPDEHLVERMPAMVDDPPLEVPIPARQRTPG